MLQSSTSPRRSRASSWCSTRWMTLNLTSQRLPVSSMITLLSGCSWIMLRSTSDKYVPGHLSIFIFALLYTRQCFYISINHFSCQSHRIALGHVALFEARKALKCLISEYSLRNGVGLICDGYCSLKPLWSGIGEELPACTSPTLHFPSPPTVL